MLYGKIVHIDPVTGTTKFTEKFGDDGGSYLSPDGNWFISTGFENGNNGLYADSLGLGSFENFGGHATVTVMTVIQSWLFMYSKGQKGFDKRCRF